MNLLTWRHINKEDDEDENKNSDLRIHGGCFGIYKNESDRLGNSAFIIGMR